MDGVQGFRGRALLPAVPDYLQADWEYLAGAFVVAAALSALGVLSWLFVVQRIRAVDWAPPAVPVKQVLASLAA